MTAGSIYFTIWYPARLPAEPVPTSGHNTASGGLLSARKAVFVPFRYLSDAMNGRIHSMPRCVRLHAAAAQTAAAVERRTPPLHAGVGGAGISDSRSFLTGEPVLRAGLYAATGAVPEAAGDLYARFANSAHNGPLYLNCPKRRWCR